MTIINCPECKKEISTAATICPHCGFPLKSKKWDATKPLDAISKVKKWHKSKLLAVIFGASILCMASFPRFLLFAGILFDPFQIKESSSESLWEWNGGSKQTRWASNMKSKCEEYNGRELNENDEILSAVPQEQIVGKNAICYGTRYVVRTTKVESGYERFSSFMCKTPLSLFSASNKSGLAKSLSTAWAPGFYCGDPYVNPYVGIELWTLRPNSELDGMDAKTINQALKPINEKCNSAIDFSSKRTTLTLVVQVITHSPAKKAGLKPCDLIERLDDYSTPDPNQVSSIIKNAKPGQVFSFRVKRGGETILFNIKPASRYY